MTYAQEIAQQALQRALDRFELVPDRPAEVVPIVYAAQAAPTRRRYRPRANLKSLAFEAVLADGRALLEAKQGRAAP